MSPTGESPRRVVVTGLGAVTPLGNDVASSWDAIVAGRSGIGRITRFDTSDYEGAIAGEVRGFEPETVLPGRRTRYMDRNAQFGAAAALEALRDAGLSLEQPLGTRGGVIFGASIGGYGVLEPQAALLREQGPRRVSPFMLPNILPDSVSGLIAILTGANGPNMAIVSASATGASAIGEAGEIIRRGDADLMIAGAGESPLTPTLYAAFAAMRAIAEPGDDPAAACKPFDLARTGFVLAEGAGALLLEELDHARARGARVYAELAGYGSANDAFDMVASEATGRGPALSMRMALRKAGIEPAGVGYINAHGTASRMNDRIETLAIRDVFGEHADRLAVSSTKSMTGHLMGAAGAVEAVFSVLALQHGLLPPTINYALPDPECDLDYVPNVARPAPGLDAVLSHSIGLGGHNASLLLRRLADA